MQGPLEAKSGTQPPPEGYTQLPALCTHEHGHPSALGAACTAPPDPHRGGLNSWGICLGQLGSGWRLITWGQGTQCKCPPCPREALWAASPPPTAGQTALAASQSKRCPCGRPAGRVRSSPARPCAGSRTASLRSSQRDPRGARFHPCTPCSRPRRTGQRVGWAEAAKGSATLMGGRAHTWLLEGHRWPEGHRVDTPSLGQAPSLQSAGSCSRPSC